MLDRILNAKKSLFALAGIIALALPVVNASAQFEQKDFELRLDGFSQTDVNFDSTDISASASLGYFFTDQFEAGVRQTVRYTDFFGSNLKGSTAIFINYHFGDVGAELQPYIGASLGYNYGDAVNDTFFAGPEIGLKYFVSEDWFIFGQAEYQLFFEDSDDADDALDDGSFLFRLGLGVVL